MDKAGSTCHGKFEMNFVPVEPQKIFLDRLSQQDRMLGYIGMGIGKSAACLQHLCDLFLSGEAVAALVVAPLRVAQLTWPNEGQLWTQFQWLRFANLRTESGQRAFLNGTAHVYTCNYESLHHLVSLIERRKGVPPYDVEIWDEITKAKNPGSKRINFFRRKLADARAPRRIGLSGTPQPNSEMDLFAQVRLIDDGARLGTSSTNFKKEFFFPPENVFLPGAKWRPKAGTLRRIEEKIHDITCTLKSSDWLDIPDTEVEDVEISFPPALQQQYETLEKELIIELKQGKTINVANSAALITKLLQFTSGHMYDESREVHPIHNLKFDALAKLVKQEKTILVATIFQHEQQRIREQFPQAKFFTDAKTPTTQNQMLDDWNAGKISMLVAHPASCGHGLNMQYGSSVMVWMTLTYNREFYDQMIARLARRGQTQVTKVYRIMASDTADWAVAESLSAKSNNEARLIAALQMLEAMRHK